MILHGRKHFERICDELIEPGELTGSGNPFHAALGHCYVRYRDLLLAEGLADFDHLQRWTTELLEDDRILNPISSGIHHLICDEYQDTSHVEELLCCGCPATTATCAWSETTTSQFTIFVAPACRT